MQFESTTPFVLFGYFDFLLLAAIVSADLLAVRLLQSASALSALAVLRFAVFFFVAPLCSTRVEVANVYREFDMVDGFNLAYIWLRWPTWWLIGLAAMIAMPALVRARQRRDGKKG